MKAVLLVSHGSRSAKTKTDVAALVQQLKQETGIAIFEYAFLEIEPPDISQGLDLCISKGASSVTVLLNFLNSGRHVDADIPEIVRQASQKYPQVKFSITSPVGQHPQIAGLFIGLIKAAVMPATTPAGRQEAGVQNNGF